MAFHREQRGQYLIEASAFRLPTGNKWQPRLTMTRLVSGRSIGPVQSFPGLTPEFATAKGAMRFACDLGRSLVDQHSPRLTV